MKIAIPSTDLKTVYKGHFGDASYFLIFSLEGSCLKFIEARKNEKFEEEIHGDPIKFKKVISVIPDVDVIAAFNVGPNVARIKLISKKEVYIIRDAEKISEFTEKLLEKMNIKVKILEGEIFYELIGEDKKTEHAGFRDYTGKFEDLLFSTVGPDNPSVKATITIAMKSE